MSLQHKLNRARNIFLTAARREGCSCSSKIVYAELAEAIEETIGHLTLLENAMRSKQQAVDALIELAKSQKTVIADLLEKLSAAPKAEDVVTDAEIQAINELAPEPVVPEPTPENPAQ